MRSGEDYPSAQRCSGPLSAVSPWACQLQLRGGLALEALVALIFVLRRLDVVNERDALVELPPLEARVRFGQGAEERDQEAAHDRRDVARNEPGEPKQA